MNAKADLLAGLRDLDALGFRDATLALLVQGETENAAGEIVRGWAASDPPVTFAANVKPVSAADAVEAGLDSTVRHWRAYTSALVDVPLSARVTDGARTWEVEGVSGALRRELLLREVP